MASTKVEAWGTSPPSTAFLIKCTKEKEKLRSKLRKQLQEHMLHMLEGCVFSDVLLGINAGRHCYSHNQVSSAKQVEELPYLLHAHEPVLKVRTPAFLEHVKQHKETTLGVTSYNTHLGEAELRQFLRKAYTDDDIRKHECEALRLSRTYADILRDGKSVVPKHLIDIDEFEKESNNSVCTENFVTPKTSPVSPEKRIDLQNMLSTELRTDKPSVVERPLKLNTGKQDEIMCVSVSSEKESRTGTCHGELSEGYASELDNTHDDESNLAFGGQKSSYSAVIPHSLDISSTSVDIDESILFDDSSSHLAVDVVLPSEEVENKETSKPDDSENSATGSGMVRSNTFDLHTQAPLEDFLDDKVCENATNGETKVGPVLASPNAPFSREDGRVQTETKTSTGFYLHHDYSPSPKPNIFDSLMSSSHDVFHNSQPPADTGGAHASNSHRLNLSMSDSGFMSYSAFSMLSDAGAVNSVSSSMVMSSDNLNSSLSGKPGEDVSASALERSKRLSGSMFPFYIDISKLPESSGISDGGKENPAPVYMYIDATDKENHDQRLHDGRKEIVGASGGAKLFSRPVENWKEGHNKLTKAVSTPHLNTSREGSVVLRKHTKSNRPRSCYMYVDLDGIDSDKSTSPKHVRRAPSSVSMYIDLNEDAEAKSPPSTKQYECQDANLCTVPVVKNHEHSVKLCSSSFEISKSNETAAVHNRKMSDSSLEARDEILSKISYSPLHRPRGNMSDSALYHLVSRDIPTQVNQIPECDNAFRLEKSKSMPRSSESFSGCPSYSSSYLPGTELSSSCYDPIKGTQLSGFVTNKRHSSFAIEEKKQNYVDHDLTKNDFDKDCGLLPMSPILRRKSARKDPPKCVTPPIAVKASTKPQDIDAMTFPRPEKKDNSRSPSRLNDSCSSEPVHEQDAGKKAEKEDIKPSRDTAKPDSSVKDKCVDSTSRSESSALSISGETSSSDKPSIGVNSKERIKSPSVIFPYEFEEDDAETVYSEVSDLSSSLGGMSSIASLERRWREGYSMIKDAGDRGIHNIYRMLEACSKLGEDLLRMFLEEIDADVLVETEGKSIKAHRCILAARCKYFATLLRESSFDDDPVINLQGFSYASVHFALCHIYGGAMNLPKDTPIVELALLADILNLETLTDVIVLHLKTHFCHFFHKPCQQCVQGVLECLPLAVSCGFNELQDKCIHWLGRYFTRTWPNKAFASLPEELQELCFQSTVKNLTIESVMEMTLNCDRLMTTLPHVKWSEPVFGMATRLLQECIHFMANNFNRILCSEGFLVLGKGQSWNVSTLEDDIISAVELMTPDVACKSCVKLSQILSLAESGTYAEYGEFTQNFIDFLHKINRHCERYLIHNANKVVHCQSWSCLPPEVQKKIKDAAVIVFEFEKPTAKPPRLSSLQRKLKKQKEKEEENAFERSTYPKPIKSRKSSRNSNEALDKTFLVQGKLEKDRRNIDQQTEQGLKKTVSPITEESHCNGADSRKEVLDAHDEDSLKEMQDLPHDHSHPSQNIYLDASHSSSVGFLESEENQSGTQCSDNPDSLDANDEMSDSKDEVNPSLLTDDGLHVEKELSSELKAEKGIDVSGGEILPQHTEKSDKSCQYHSAEVLPDSDKVPVPDEKQIQRNCSEALRGKRSPVKSYVPLPKAHNHLERESSLADNQCKDLVAEIDADSRMVTHCLQEAEMLEQQLSRRLQHQQQIASSSTKTHTSSTHVVPSARRSSRSSFMNRMQKSVSSSQVKSMVSASGRGKSPARIAPSYSGPHVPRLLRSENSKDLKSLCKPVSVLKGSVVPVQRTYRSVECAPVVHSQKQTGGKRVSSRSTGGAGGGNTSK